MVLKFQRRFTRNYMKCPIFVLFHEERFCFYGIMWQNTTMRPRSISVSVTNALCMVFELVFLLCEPNSFLVSSHCWLNKGGGLFKRASCLFPSSASPKGKRLSRFFRRVIRQWICHMFNSTTVHCM